MNYTQHTSLIPNPYRVPPRVCYVTAFWDINRVNWNTFSRSVEIYLEAGHRLTKLFKSPAYHLIIYMDTRHIDRLDPSVYENPFIDVIPIDEAWMIQYTAWKDLEKERKILQDPQFKSRIAGRENCPETQYPEYTLTMHSKVDWMTDAINRYPSVEWFAWIDFGYLCKPQRIPVHLVDPSVLHPTRVNVGLFRLPTHHDANIDYTLKHAPEVVAGTSYVGSRHAIIKYIESYHQTLDRFQNQYSITDDDQHIMIHAILTNPSLCNGIFIQWDTVMHIWSSQTRPILYLIGDPHRLQWTVNALNEIIRREEYRVYVVALDNCHKTSSSYFLNLLENVCGITYIDSLVLDPVITLDSRKQFYDEAYIYSRMLNSCEKMTRDAPPAYKIVCAEMEQIAIDLSGVRGNDSNTEGVYIPDTWIDTIEYPWDSRCNTRYNPGIRLYTDIMTSYGPLGTLKNSYHKSQVMNALSTSLKKNIIPSSYITQIETKDDMMGWYTKIKTETRIIVIPSVIHVRSGMSKYTDEERFQQTIYQLQSLQTQSNLFIILCEMSHCTLTEYQSFSKYTDIVVDWTDNEQCMQYAHQSQNKSWSEMYLQVCIMDSLQRLNVEYSHIAKFGGRYHLSTSFSSNRVFQTLPVFREIPRERSWDGEAHVVTVFYTIPYTAVELFCATLRQILIDREIHSKTDVEHLLYDKFIRHYPGGCIRTYQLGIQGYMAGLPSRIQLL